MPAKMTEYVLAISALQLRKMTGVFFLAICQMMILNVLWMHQTVVGYSGLSHHAVLGTQF